MINNERTYISITLTSFYKKYLFWRFQRFYKCVCEVFSRFFNFLKAGIFRAASAMRHKFLTFLKDYLNIDCSYNTNLVYSFIAGLVRPYRGRGTLGYIIERCEAWCVWLGSFEVVRAFVWVSVLIVSLLLWFISFVWRHRYAILFGFYALSMVCLWGWLTFKDLKSPMLPAGPIIKYRWPVSTNIFLNVLLHYWDLFTYLYKYASNFFTEVSKTWQKSAHLDWMAQPIVISVLLVVNIIVVTFRAFITLLTSLTVVPDMVTALIASINRYGLNAVDHIYIDIDRLYRPAISASYLPNYYSPVFMIGSQSPLQSGLYTYLIYPGLVQWFGGVVGVVIQIIFHDIPAFFVCYLRALAEAWLHRDLSRDNFRSVIDTAARLAEGSCINLTLLSDTVSNKNGRSGPFVKADISVISGYFSYLYSAYLVGTRTLGGVLYQIVTWCTDISTLKASDIVAAVNRLDGAWFLRFGYLFLATTLASLLSISYLGLYGVFLCNFPPLVLFWATALWFLRDTVLNHSVYTVNLGKWFVFNGTSLVPFELYIDYISVSFIVLTLTIAMCVYVYCFSYFRAEPNVERLILFINLFVASMVLLVSSGNMVVLFLGWELIGLTSFFLINFWSTRAATLKAAFKAFTFNKFSDVCILIAVLMCYTIIGDFNVVVLNNSIANYVNYHVTVLGHSISFVELLSGVLLTAAFIKSAQFGAHIWLPDSMEAPVPASALIHSATLVSAGVYLLLRFSPVFELSTYAHNIVLAVGAVTAFFGGVSAAYQSDVKRILAYSTISHCGFMMVCFCTSSVEYTLLYLYVHGFFKAAIFLCMGNVIRFSRNYQDFRKMGGFYKVLPLECVVSALCLMNLSGLPFTLGFYIKHLLLLGLPSETSWFIYTSVLGGAVSGLIYSYRLFYYVFFDVKKAKKIVYIQAAQTTFVSRLYTTTTAAAAVAIVSLTVLAYVISSYYFSLVLGALQLKSEFSHFSFVAGTVADYFEPTFTLNKNASYTNWLIILIAVLVVLVKWRYTYRYSLTVTWFWMTINFFIFFYFFSCIIF